MFLRTNAVDIFIQIAQNLDGFSGKTLRHFSYPRSINDIWQIFSSRTGID